MAKRVFDAIMYEEIEVFIQWYTTYAQTILDALLPYEVKMKINHIMAGEGMKGFVGRDTSIVDKKNN